MSKLPPRFQPADTDTLVAAIDTITTRLLTPAPLPLCDVCGCLSAPGEPCPACQVTAQEQAAVEATADGYHRCRSCTGLFPVLVDDLFCLRCDGVLFPSSPAPTSPATLVVADLREAS